MVDGWLIYNRDDYDKNRWFADRLAQGGRDCGLGLSLRFADELGPGGGALPAGGAPAFAVNRSRDWRIARMLERAGCRVFNPSETARVGNDKIESHALAARLGLPQVGMAVCRNDPESVARHGLGYPAVLKNPHGHGGSDVHMVRSEAELRARASAMPCERVLVQRVCGRPGEDVRVYVLGGRVLAAVRRFSNDDFRANLSLGGSAEYYEPCDRMREMVARLAGALCMDYAGVDFILDANGGPLFNEIEDAVGARSLYRLGGHDPTALFLRHIRSELGR